MNRAGLTYKLAANHLSDQTNQEIRMLRGKLRSSGPNRGLPFHYTSKDLESIPDNMDWRLYGAVSSVKGTIFLFLSMQVIVLFISTIVTIYTDQAVCGSCWSFGTVGTLEGSLFLKTGKLTRLSQQVYSFA